MSRSGGASLDYTSSTWLSDADVGDGDGNDGCGARGALDVVAVCGVGGNVHHASLVNSGVRMTVNAHADIEDGGNLRRDSRAKR